MTRRCSLPLLIGLPLVILACNLFSPGAAKTVETFMYAVEKGNIDEARNLCSAGLQAMLGPKLGVALAAQGETLRQRGGIKSIETTERVVEETAAVQATIKYGNGQSEQAQMKLLKENGVWRISQ